MFPFESLQGVAESLTYCPFLQQLTELGQELWDIYQIYIPYILRIRITQK